MQKSARFEYATLADAIAAAKDGDTVTLTADINTPETSYYIQKSLTIDLGGKTLTGSGYDGVFNIEGENAAVRIKNGKIVAVEQTALRQIHDGCLGLRCGLARLHSKISMSASRLPIRMTNRWI